MPRKIRAADLARIHREAPLIDLHMHPPLKLFLFANVKLYEPHKAARHDVFAMRADLPSITHGVVPLSLATTHIPEKQLLSDCILIPIVASANHRATELFTHHYDDMTRAMMNNFEQAVLVSQSRFNVIVCTDFPSTKRALAAGKTVFCHAVEGSHSLRGRRSLLDNLNDLFSRGVCMLTLAHFYDHKISPPAPGVPDDTFPATIKCFPKALKGAPTRPLWKGGADVVRFMLEKGMLVDLTHTGPVARQDVFKLWSGLKREYQRPLVMSHVGLREMANHAMNPDWDEIEFIRKTGGVIGVLFMNYWLTGSTPPDSRDTFEYVVSAIELLVSKGFEDTIALGSDFDGFTLPPRNLEKPADMLNLTEELLTGKRFGRKTYSEAQVKKFLGGNFLRVMDEGWKH